MHPDSVIIDFEKDVNGNISSVTFTTIVNGEIFCYDIPYNQLILPVAVMLETVRENEMKKEQIFQNQVQREIQGLIK